MSPLPVMHEHTVSYDDVELSLSAIGGIHNLLLMLPGIMPDIEEATLQLIEAGIERQEPVDMRLDLPGVTYLMHLRGTRDTEGA